MEEENKVEKEKVEVANEDALQADRVQKLEEEIATLKDTLLRKVAESDNLRKRLEKEKEDAIKYSQTKFAKDLLAVIDNFERVTENSVIIRDKIETDESLKAFFDGIVLCEKELLSVFKKYGISRLEVKEGDVFNPEYQQAMCELDSPDHKAGSVIKLFQAGYMYNDRLLRPAMVSVSKKSS
ncbi:MAG: nucleotide exchange factor GrpE [Holosporaceae bacterium]|jgi:molecular chaperone GrpE|nr:nucleotide exchange factor GrpE [Holosporaceae bacterium]